MKTRLHSTRPRGGFTLVESLIAATLLAVMFLAVAQTSSRASDAFEEGNAEHTLSTRTHRCLERLARLVELSDRSILTGDVPTERGDDRARFRIPVDFVGEVVVWMGVELFAEPEPGELDDGADNDGDGLVDEFRVVELLAPGTPEERRTVLASGVAELLAGELANDADDNENGLTDEAGLSFSSEGDVVTLRLTCQRRDEGGRLLTKTAETAVRLRN